MRRWAYKHLSFKFPNRNDDMGDHCAGFLSDFGEQGWELVAVTRTDDGFYRFFLKRPGPMVEPGTERQ